ncbi:MAG: response regulator transcription factor, partial [Chloroflexota bacterium]
ELVTAVRTTALNRRYLSNALPKEEIHARLLKKNEIQETPLNLLTPRQREVLQLIAEGYTTKEISKMLCISYKTVETHRSNLMNKFGIHDVSELVTYAIENGLVPTPDSYFV